MWRENGDAPHKNIVDLLCRFPHRRGRGDNLRLDCSTFKLPAAKFVYCSLIESNHGAQWTANEVELVLNDQIRRPDCRDVLDRRAWQSLVRTMSTGAVGS